MSHLSHNHIHSASHRSIVLHNTGTHAMHSWGHNNHQLHRGQHIRVLDPNMIADAVFVMTTKGMDSSCGCPYFCPGPSISCGNGPFLPDELHGLMSHEEYSDLVHTLNEIFRRTHWPVMPLCFFLCLDFCAFAMCRNLRMQEVHHALDSVNQKLAERGLHWQPLDYEGYVAKLCINKTARQAYLTRNNLPPDIIHGHLPPLGDALAR